MDGPQESELSTNFLGDSYVYSSLRASDPEHGAGHTAPGYVSLSLLASMLIGLH